MYKHSQLGYFIDSNLWKDALKLLNFQIDQKSNNKHYSTLSIFYYENLRQSSNLECINHNPEDYFSTRVASSLFYGLENEFVFYHYVIPKKGLGLRDYVFFSYPARILYYAVGLYLLKLSQEFLTEIHSKLRNVQSFYGGKLNYKKGELIVNKVNIYYRSHYEEFKAKVEDEIKFEKQNKVILKLDIENYFGEISIPILLDRLENFIKPSVKSEMKFDIFAKEQIHFFFDFIMKNTNGIPQSENNIISNFIGYLYMSLGDFILDDLLKGHSEIILDYKVIRFVDDIYVSIRFSEHISYDKQKEFTLYIASEIAESLYTALKLRLNLKTRAYHLVEEEDAGELLSRIKDFADSHEGAAFDYDTFLSENETETVYVDDTPFENDEKPPQQLLNDIFQELDKLKNSNVEEFFIRSNAPILSEEVFQNIFKKSVYNLARKAENREKLGSAFEDFNFDLIKVKSLEIIILLLLNEGSKQRFRNFLLQKKSITTSDADLTRISHQP